MRSRVRGSRSFRRLLKGIPDAVRGKMRLVLEAGGRALAAEMRRRAPRKSGALAGGITSRLIGNSLRMRVGLIGTPLGRAKLFYGRIQDLGRKERVVKVRRFSAADRGVWLDRIRGGTARGSRKPSDLGKAYDLPVKAMAPKRFITGQFPNLRATIGRGLRGIWERALGSMAGSNDNA